MGLIGLVRQVIALDNVLDSIRACKGCHGYDRGALCHHHTLELMDTASATVIELEEK